MKNNSNQAVISMLIGCILFGAGSVIVAHVPLGAYAIAFWRLAIAAVVFIVLAKVYAPKWPVNAAVRRNAIGSGIFLAFDLALWHESIHAIGPGIATLLNGLQIFWLAAIGLVWLREKLNLMQLGSLCVAIIGIALLSSPEFEHNPNATWGIITGAVSGLMFALSVVAMRRAQQLENAPIFTVMQWLSIGGALVLLLPMCVLDAGKILPQTGAQLGWLLTYGVVGQCVAWAMIGYAVPHLRLNLTGLLLLSEPVAALLLDVLFLDKNIGGIQWLGVVLTMTAIYVGTLQNRATH